MKKGGRKVDRIESWDVHYSIGVQPDKGILEAKRTHEVSLPVTQATDVMITKS